ncbi:hypothetical protein [Methylobacterium ajmalii]|jgi:hypothetical protein|uniref:hypothetical protein n=1 Tax=Methylobacterium ajmalii TaxID=2738439 RepID=UPI00190BDD3E|nr:hypothetical protein [Methylobacterium ajmalii]MBK3400833.1 hypothetical protein [Methylobacterium ajmalii]MBK3412275.1 hypothetical protein [Methylobacterium ajmalii]MBK3426884.1 hypothetical protein [Methylobacterium ajmalii]MBZ6416931.1 hypothetical protein [Methylobacterium sp.]
MTGKEAAAREAFAAAEPDSILASRPMAGAQAAVEGVLRRVGLPADPDVVATIALFSVAGFFIGGGEQPGFAEAVLNEVIQSANTPIN